MSARWRKDFDQWGSKLVECEASHIEHARRLEFVTAVAAKLERGAREYGDSSFGLSFGEILKELRAEAVDMAGWSYVCSIGDKATGLQRTSLHKVCVKSMELYSLIRDIGDALDKPSPKQQRVDK